VPEHMRNGMLRYAIVGIPPGSFLLAVIDNDLQKSVACADEKNLPLIALYAQWFRFIAPPDCHGSVEKRIAWVRMHKLLREPVA